MTRFLRTWFTVLVPGSLLLAAGLWASMPFAHYNAVVFFSVYAAYLLTVLVGEYAGTNTTTGLENRALQAAIAFGLMFISSLGVGYLFLFAATFNSTATILDGPGAVVAIGLVSITLLGAAHAINHPWPVLLRVVATYCITAVVAAGLLLALEPLMPDTHPLLRLGLGVVFLVPLLFLPSLAAVTIRQHLSQPKVSL